MARSIANVQVGSDTFGSWIARTNDIATAFAQTVTVSTSTGDLTTGNGFVIGVLGANTITATTIRGGNVSSTSNLSILSNTAIGNATSQVIVTHNATSQIKTSTYTTTNTDAQLMDSFAVTDYRTSKYLISINNTNNNDYQSTEIMLLQTGTGASVTEYATLISTSTLAHFSANVNAGVVRLFVTPIFNDNVIKYQRTSLAV